MSKTQTITNTFVIKPLTVRKLPPTKVANHTPRLIISGSGAIHGPHDNLIHNTGADNSSSIRYNQFGSILLPSSVYNNNSQDFNIPSDSHTLMFLPNISTSTSSSAVVGNTNTQSLITLNEVIQPEYDSKYSTEDLIEALLNSVEAMGLNDEGVQLLNSIEQELKLPAMNQGTTDDQTNVLKQRLNRLNEYLERNEVDRHIERLQARIKSSGHNLNESEISSLRQKLEECSGDDRINEVSKRLNKIEQFIVAKSRPGLFGGTEEDQLINSLKQYRQSFPELTRYIGSLNRSSLTDDQLSMVESALLEPLSEFIRNMNNNADRANLDYPLRRLSQFQASICDENYRSNLYINIERIIAQDLILRHGLQVINDSEFIDALHSIDLEYLRDEELFVIEKIIDSDADPLYGRSTRLKNIKYKISYNIVNFNQKKYINEFIAKSGDENCWQSAKSGACLALAARWAYQFIQKPEELPSTRMSIFNNSNETETIMQNMTNYVSEITEGKVHWTQDDGSIVKLLIQSGLNSSCDFMIKAEIDRDGNILVEKDINGNVVDDINIKIKDTIELLNSNNTYIIVFTTLSRIIDTDSTPVLVVRGGHALGLSYYDRSLMSVNAIFDPNLGECYSRNSASLGTVIEEMYDIILDGVRHATNRTIDTITDNNSICLVRFYRVSLIQK